MKSKSAAVLQWPCRREERVHPKGPKLGQKVKVYIKT
jgi:hypothetical protein